MYSTKKPDIILCGIDMPKMNGFKVLEIIKSNPRTAKIPFIFITSSAEKRDIEAGMVAGADGYLTKPFKMDELISMMNQLLE